MALKIALFAALCVAQAFAFQPSSLAIDEVGQPRRDINYEVFTECFKRQRSEFRNLGDIIPEVPGQVLVHVTPALRREAAKYFRLLREPLEDIAFTVIDGHRVMYNYLRKYEVKNASQEMMQRMKNIAANFEAVRGTLQKAVEETPEMDLWANWVLNSLNYEIEKSKTAMRQTFGQCLADSKAYP